MAIHSDAHMGCATAALVWASMVLVLADAIAYLLIIRGEGGAPPDSAATVRFISGYMLLMAVLLWLSLLDHPRLVMLRPAMRAGAAAGLLLLGVFGAFSIGVPLFLAGILATIAAIRALAGRNLKNAMLSEVAAAVIAVTALVGGASRSRSASSCDRPTGRWGAAGPASSPGPTTTSASTAR
jgi:hypothetical protein